MVTAVSLFPKPRQLPMEVTRSSMMVKYSSHSTSWSSDADVGAHITVSPTEPAENTKGLDERGE